MRTQKISAIIKILVKQDEMSRSRSTSEEEEDQKDRQKETTIMIIVRRRIICKLVLEK
jgi:hypothetical protein